MKYMMKRKEVVPDEVHAAWLSKESNGARD
jgi:hypothetical protein